MTVNHPQFGNMCEICFDKVTIWNATIDKKGRVWDIHRGQCAKEAGIDEMTCIMGFHGWKQCGNEPCTCKDEPHTVREVDD